MSANKVLQPKTPKEIVELLDRHVIGQSDAKRAIAIAFRNRWRRKQLEREISEEIYPRNILMVGPTGVGKTEIARRLARLVEAPFIKVEATKFTEVGYVGRDVDSIIRDLIDVAYNAARDRAREANNQSATKAAEAKIINILVGEGASEETKNKFYERLHSGALDDKEVEISLPESQNAAASNMPMFDFPGGQMGVFNLGDMISKSLGGPKMKMVKLPVKEALIALIREESDRMVDETTLTNEALRAVEEDGIVFIDEIDKICSRNDGGKGEVSREGVQRDLLPLIEGTSVSTKYGIVKTDHILFIASGAFHLSKPSDLLPELQGRLPIRVELKALTQGDFERILVEPKASLLRQYEALFRVEGVEIAFEESGIKEIARIATDINREVENIGARRLHTIMEKLLEGLNYTANELAGSKVVVDAEYVATHLADITSKQDLAKFIL